MLEQLRWLNIQEKMRLDAKKNEEVQKVDVC